MKNWSFIQYVIEPTHRKYNGPVKSCNSNSALTILKSNWSKFIRRSLTERKTVNSMQFQNIMTFVVMLLKVMSSNPVVNGKKMVLLKRDSIISCVSPRTLYRMKEYWQSLGHAMSHVIDTFYEKSCYCPYGGILISCKIYKMYSLSISTEH